jgi:predicted transcriptional regulator
MAEAKDQSIFEIELDAAHEERLEAEADFAAGRVVPHSRVQEWLLKLAWGERTPPPEA